MAQITKGKIIFDRSDWTKGLHPNYSLGITNRPIPLGDQYATAMNSFNPYRQNYFGLAAPSYGVFDVTNSSVVTDSPLRRIEIAYDDGTNSNKFFAINSNTKLFRGNASDGELENAGSWPHTVTPASGTVVLNDLAVYTADVGASSLNRLYYSYNRVGANAWDVGMYDLNGSAADDDFLSTVPSLGAGVAFTGENQPHPLIVGDDDVLYIGNGNELLGYDGVTGANGEVFTALVLPKTFRIQTMAKRNQRLVIFGYFITNTTNSLDALPFASTQSKAYFWDYLNINPYDSVDLEDSMVTCAVQYKSTIGCFTQGRPSVTGSLQPVKFRLYNGEKFEVAVSFDANNSLSANGLPFNGAYDTLGDCIVWSSNGNLFQYGNPYPGQEAKLFKVASGDGSNSGALRVLDQETVVFSSGTGTAGGLQYFEVTSSTVEFASGFFRTQLVEPSFPEGQIGKVNSVKIIFGKTSSSSANTLSIGLIGNNTSHTTIFSDVQVTNDTIVTQVYYDENGNKLPYFSNLAVTLNWSTSSPSDDVPMVESIEVFYETINDTVTA